MSLELMKYKIDSILQRYFNDLTLGHGNNIIYWILQIIMIVGAISFILTAVLLPSNPLTYTANLDEHTRIKSSVVNDQVTAVMLLLKGLVFLAGLGFGVAAFLCSKVRKRNNLLSELEEELEEIKEQLSKS